jgi:hypothetical protein
VSLPAHNAIKEDLLRLTSHTEVLMVFGLPATPAVSTLSSHVQASVSICRFQGIKHSMGFLKWIGFKTTKVSLPAHNVTREDSLTLTSGMKALMVFGLPATPAVSTPISPVKILLTSTTIKQTWNVLTLFVLALVQGVKGDGFTNIAI